MDFPPSLYKAVFDQIMSNTVFTQAYIDPELDKEEERRLLKEQTELIWKRLCRRWATKHSPRIHVLYDRVVFYSDGTREIEMQWWED